MAGETAPVIFALFLGLEEEIFKSLVKKFCFTFWGFILESDADQISYRLWNDVLHIYTWSWYFGSYQHLGYPF